MTNLCDLYFSYLTYVLEEEYPNSPEIDNPNQYTTEVTDEVNFTPSSESTADVTYQVLFGAARKIEGATDSYVTSVVINAYAEIGTNGAFTAACLNYLFKTTSMKSISINGTTLYPNLSSPVIINSRYESDNSYRVVYMMQGSIIASGDNQIGHECEISLNDGSFQRIQVINPTSIRNNNISMQPFNSGFKAITDGPLRSGSITFIAKKDVITRDLLRYIEMFESEAGTYLSGSITSLAIRKTFIGPNNDTFQTILNKLVITEASYTYDVTTRATLITINYSRADING